MKNNLLTFEKAVLILFILGIIAIIIGTNNKSGMEETDYIIEKLTDGNHEISIVEENKLKESMVTKLDSMDYDEIKNIIGTENDFCIYFEDENGNLVRVDGANIGIGSDKIYINGKSCS